MPDQLLTKIRDTLLKYFFSTECKGKWTAPDGWTGSRPVVYRNLDNSMGLTLGRGSEIVPEKVFFFLCTKIPASFVKSNILMLNSLVLHEAYL